MAKSLIMAKYVREQKHMLAGMKNRKSPNRDLLLVSYGFTIIGLTIAPGFVWLHNLH